MNRTPVKSSYVKSVGHEGDTLEVEISDGKVYRYKGIPRDEYDKAMSGESIGRELRGIIHRPGMKAEFVEPEIIVLDD